jgi:flavodoxin
MTGKKALIVYGTRYGSAEGISETMADFLREKDTKVY